MTCESTSIDRDCITLRNKLRVDWLGLDSGIYSQYKKIMPFVLMAVRIFKMVSL